MNRQQTGNLLIGSGVVVGLGTVAYWLFKGGWESLTSEMQNATTQYAPSITTQYAIPTAASTSASAWAAPSESFQESWATSPGPGVDVTSQRIFDRGY